MQCSWVATLLKATLGTMVARVVTCLSSAVGTTSDHTGTHLRRALAAAHAVLSTPYESATGDALGVGPDDDGLLDAGTEILVLEQMSILVASAIIAKHPQLSNCLPNAAGELFPPSILGAQPIRRLYGSLQNMFFLRGSNVAPPKSTVPAQLSFVMDALIGVNGTTDKEEIKRRQTAASTSALSWDVRKLAAEAASDRRMRRQRASGDSGVRFLQGAHPLPSPVLDATDAHSCLQPSFMRLVRTKTSVCSLCEACLR